MRRPLGLGVHSIATGPPGKSQEGFLISYQQRRSLSIICDFKDRDKELSQPKHSFLQEGSSEAPSPGHPVKSFLHGMYQECLKNYLLKDQLTLFTILSMNYQLSLFSNISLGIMLSTWQTIGKHLMNKLHMENFLIVQWYQMHFP